MLGSCLAVTIIGIENIGGITKVWEIGQMGGRTTLFEYVIESLEIIFIYLFIIFSMNPNPLERITFWSASFGMAFIFVAHSGCSASTLQRYMSLTGQREAKMYDFCQLTFVM